MPPQNYASCQATLQANPKTWLITGVAGFIGSNLLETLLLLDQTVVGLDNFATGHHHNLDEVQTLVSHEQWGALSVHGRGHPHPGGLPRRPAQEWTTCCTKPRWDPCRAAWKTQ